MRHDAVRALLQLPHALEETQEVGVVLDLDAHQRRHRRAQQLGQLLYRFKLDDLAFFHAVHHGARHTQLGSDVFCLQRGADAVGTQAVTQGGVVNR